MLTLLRLKEFPGFMFCINGALFKDIGFLLGRLNSSNNGVLVKNVEALFGSYFVLFLISCSLVP